MICLCQDRTNWRHASGCESSSSPELVSARRRRQESASAGAPGLESARGIPTCAPKADRGPEDQAETAVTSAPPLGTPASPSEEEMLRALGEWTQALRLPFIVGGPGRIYSGLGSGFRKG